jgi:predicted membrane channel-forming protein YqfA (hemolysin III family)
MCENKLPFVFAGDFPHIQSIVMEKGLYCAQKLTEAGIISLINFVRAIGYIYNWLHIVSPQRFYITLTMSYLAMGCACLLIAIN